MASGGGGLVSARLVMAGVDTFFFFFVVFSQAFSAWPTTSRIMSFVTGFGK